MICKNVILAIFCLALINCDAQIIKALKIGDIVPRTSVITSINQTDTNLDLSLMKGKLIILDFWNEWCTACIAGFPKMQQLQDKYSDKISILLVTNQSKSELKQLFLRSPILKNTKLPFIFGDSILHSLFPHKAVPFHVWIDGAGRVAATTDGWNTTEKNVQDFLMGKKLNLHVRQDGMDFKLGESFMAESQMTLLKYLKHYSVLLSRINETAKSAFKIITDSNTRKDIGYQALNYPMIALYANAYDLPDFSKLIVEAIDASKYYLPVNPGKLDSWNKENTFCYELKLPSTSNLNLNNLKEIFQQDLKRYFGFDARYEIRKLKCWVLTRNTKDIKFSSKGGEEIAENTLNGWIIRNQPFSVIKNILSTSYLYGLTPIIIDETHYDGRVDMNIASNTSDLKALQNEFSSYGISITEEERNIKVLVLAHSENQ